MLTFSNEFESVTVKLSQVAILVCIRQPKIEAHDSTDKWIFLYAQQTKPIHPKSLWLLNKTQKRNAFIPLRSKKLTWNAHKQHSPYSLEFRFGSNEHRQSIKRPSNNTHCNHGHSSCIFDWQNCYISPHMEVLFGTYLQSSSHLLSSSSKVGGKIKESEPDTFCLFLCL